MQNRASSLVLEVAVAGGQQHHTVPGTRGGGGARQRGSGTSPNGTQCRATSWQQQRAVPWLADPCAQIGAAHLLQQSMASWSRRLPPGCTMALTPAWGEGGTCSGVSEMRQQVGRLHSLWHVALQQAQGKPSRLLVCAIQACSKSTGAHLAGNLHRVVPGEGEEGVGGQHRALQAIGGHGNTLTSANSFSQDWGRNGFDSQQVLLFRAASTQPAHHCESCTVTSSSAMATTICGRAQHNRPRSWTPNPTANH